MHNLLEKVIESLSSENVLSSWSVYNENSGWISLKIRYLEASCQANRYSNSHFRRNSQRQVNRDRARQQRWKASRKSVTAAHNSDQSAIAEPELYKPGTYQTLDLSTEIHVRMQIVCLQQ